MDKLHRNTKIVLLLHLDIAHVTTMLRSLMIIINYLWNGRLSVGLYKSNILSSTSLLRV